MNAVEAATIPNIRVVLADDHALVRKGIRKILENTPGIDVVGEAASGIEALNLVEELSPDVLVVDMSMPVIDGLEVVHRLSRAQSKTATLMVTMFDEAHMAERVLTAGASGFITKDAPQARLIDAVNAVASGESYICPTLATGANPDVLSSLQGLSAREFQVMCCLGRGLTNREISAQLDIGMKTVDSHRARVLKKLKLRNNAELARFTVRHGFVEI